MLKAFSRPPRATIEALAGSADILSELIESIPRERLDTRRRPHFWSIREHVAHLAEVQPMLFGRFERFRDEETPNFTPYIPSDATVAEANSSSPATVEEAIADFRVWRGKQISLIEALPDAVWAKQALHPEYELYSAGILARHVAMHDHWHMYRIEELWITKDDFLTEVE